MIDIVVKDSGERQNYASEMHRDTQTGKPNYRLIDIPFLTRIAVHLTKDAEKYGRDNWRKANSLEELERFKDSAFWHLMQYLSGEIDEDHMAAVCVNLMAAEHTMLRIEEAMTEAKALDNAHYLVGKLQPYFDARFRLYSEVRGGVITVTVESCRTKEKACLSIASDELDYAVDKDGLVSIIVDNLLTQFHM